MNHRIRLLGLILAGALAFTACASAPQSVQTEPAIQTEAPTQPTQTELAPTDPALTQPDLSHLHSGIRGDGTFGEGMLLIGDSLTFGLVRRLTEIDLIGDARYMARVGVPACAFFSTGSTLEVVYEEIESTEPTETQPETASAERPEEPSETAPAEEQAAATEPAETQPQSSASAVSGSVTFSDDEVKRKIVVNSICTPQFYGMTFSEAVAAAGGDVTAIYLMLGTNYDLYASAEQYIEIVDYLLECCPDATVYLQTIPISTRDSVHYGEVNSYIREAALHYQDLEEDRVQLIDIFDSVGEEYLKSDGVHLENTGYEAWYDVLVAYAAENHIPE